MERIKEKIGKNFKKIAGEINESEQKMVEEISDITEKTISNKDSKNKANGPKKIEPQLVFNLYDISKVEVNDPGLKNAINLDYKLVIKSHGRTRERFGKGNVNIIERLINVICVPGHRGKKHKIITRWATGKYNKNASQVLEALRIINEKTKKDPIQVLIDAVINGSPMDEVTMIQYGGARYPQAVDTSPLRRVSVALRNIVHGAYDKSFNKKKTFSIALAEELIATSNRSGDSIAVTKKTELEKQADAAR